MLYVFKKKQRCLNYYKKNISYKETYIGFNLVLSSYKDKYLYIQKSFTTVKTK